MIAMSGRLLQHHENDTITAQSHLGKTCNELAVCFFMISKIREFHFNITQRHLQREII